jgi:ribosomal protein S18
MKPVPRQNKIIQFVITVFLVVVLLGIVGLYIYYGMYVAKKADITIDTPTIEVVVPQSEEDDYARRLKILSDFATETFTIGTSSATGTVVTSTKDRMKTLESLAASTSTVDTLPQDRLDTLEALKNQVIEVQGPETN